MKKLPLLPHGFQKLGFILFLPFMALGIASIGWDFEFSWLSFQTHAIVNEHIIDFGRQNLTDEVAAVGSIITLMLIAFSKERTEDEAIQFFRLASLQWAVIVNYLVLIICIFAIYGGDFMSVMMYNMFTILIIFNVRFRFILFMHNKASV